MRAWMGLSLIWVGSSDFENKFVCGEIMTYEDLKEYGSESAVKAVSWFVLRVGVLRLIIFLGWETSSTRQTL
jgi:hypothetical protein